jgi:DNA-binding NarL/FixJ family response regulator
MKGFPHQREKENRIRVIIVDDHSVVRDGVRMTLENDDRIEVVGEASNVIETLTLVREEQPDVVLLDLALLTGTSLPAIPKILELHPSSRILVLTGVLDENMHKQALLLGAHGVLLKHNASDVLAHAIVKVHDGEAWVDRHLTAKVLDEAARKDKARSAMARKFDALTDRERDIVRLIAEGHNNHFIGDELKMSEKTVRNRLTVIYSKLEVDSRLELAILASQDGIDL